MAYEQRDNEGTLGKNNRKEKDTHPSHTGKCVIGGKAYWISAWVKDGNNNEKFFSLSFKPKDEEQRAAPSRGGAKFSEVDSDIPFVVSLLEYSVESPKARRLGRADF